MKYLFNLATRCYGIVALLRNFTTGYNLKALVSRNATPNAKAFIFYVHRFFSLFTHSRSDGQNKKFPFILIR